MLKGGVAALFIRDLLGIMVTLMPPPPARRDEYMANWASRLEKLCARTEAATIKRVVHTWKDLVRYMDHLGLKFPDPHALATFIREHHGPTRVFTSLGWMIRNLRVPLDLREASKPAPVRSTRLGQGQSQAAPLEPGMVTHLLGVLEYTAEHAHWPILMAAAAMVFGLIRFCHVQRSYLIGANSAIIIFWCFKGKTGSRDGFTWSIPRHLGSLDLYAIWTRQLDKVRPRHGEGYRRWHFLAFDSDTGVPVSIGQFLRVVRPYFDGVLDVQNLSSYSFRRVVPTLAGIVRLTDTERLAIGQWTDAASGGSTAQTPLRYDARKQKQGHQLRLAAALFLASASELLWEEIKTTSAVERWSEAMIAADELLSENPRVIRASSEDIPGMPMVKSLLPASLAVIRTAGQKIIRALRKRAATASTGSSSSQPQPKPSVSPRLAPRPDEPPLQRRRLPQKKAAQAAPEQVTPAPVVLPVPASQATVEPPSPVRVPGTPAVAVKKKPQPPAAKARPPPPAGPFNEVSDAMFDIAARERWAHPGHGGRPEPPTLVFWGADGHGSLYLAGLPKDPRWVSGNDIGFIASAMEKTAAECPGGVAQRDCFQMSCPVAYQGVKRDQALQDIKQAAFATLAAGKNVVVHCQAGVHRAPILMAILLAWIKRTDFDQEYTRLEGLRAIDRQGVLKRRGGEALFSWARSSCGGNLPQLPRYPVVFICSTKAGALWHVEREGAPWCRWRQASPGFRGDTHRATSVHEALGYDRQICKSCQVVLPGPDRRALA